MVMDAENKSFEPNSYCIEVAASMVGANSRVDRKNGIIRGVKVLSPFSVSTARRIGLSEAMVGAAANKPYGYSADAMKKALPLYQNAAVYVNHPPIKVLPNGKRIVEGAERPLQDKFGRLVNPSIVTGSANPADDGIVADLEYLTTHPFAPQAAEAAEKMPNSLALSHLASPGEYSVKDGRVMIESIEQVRSVDLVGDRPGTNKSIFESAAYDTELPQMLTAPADADSDSPDAALRAALKTSLCSIIDDDKLDTVSMKSKLTDHIKAIGGAMTKIENAGAAAESAATETKLDDVLSRLAAVESRNAKLELIESTRVAFREAGVDTDEVLIEAACSLDEPKRKAFIERLPKKPAADARRVRGSAPVIAESAAGVADEDKNFVAPTTAKEFADRLTLTR